MVSMRGTRTLTKRVKHVWGGFGGKIGAQDAVLWEELLGDSTYIRLWFDQDDRKPALCSLASAAGQTPRLCKTTFQTDPLATCSVVP